MKSTKILLFALVVSAINPFLGFCQGQPLYKTNLPYNQEAKLEFERIVEIKEVDKDEIYNRAKLWFVKNYRSSNDVIQLDDKESGRLIGKGIYNYIITDILPLQFSLHHQISVFVKDGKAKIVLNNFHVEFEGTDLTMEELVSDDILYKRNGKPKKMPKEHKENLLKIWSRIATQIEKSLEGDGDGW